MNQAIIIARVSTEDQRDAGNSLPAQTSRMVSYCERKDLKVIKSFAFDESAYKERRDEFDEIVSFILSQKEPIVVCFDKVDRLSRNIFDQRVSLLYGKAINDEIELHFVSDGQIISSKLSAGEKFQFSVTLGLAKYYADAISDNVKRAREQQLRNGQYPHRAPFGYINIDDDQGKKNIQPDVFNAAVVQKLFEWYASGAYSMLELTHHANKTFNIKLSKSHVGQMLENPFYYGVMVVGGKEYPHKYKPIISKSLFDEVTARRMSFGKKPHKFVGIPYAYRGLISCAECGCLISPEKKKERYTYYHCTQAKWKHSMVWMTEENLTEQLSKALAMLTLPSNVYDDILEALKASHSDKKEYHGKLLAEYQKDYAVYEGRIEKMYEDRLDGRITESQYDNLYQKYRKKQTDLQIRIDQLQQADETYYITASYLLELSQRAIELFKSSEPHQKRKIVQLTLQNLRLEGDILRYDWQNPFSALAEYANRQTWLRGLDSNQQP